MVGYSVCFGGGGWAGVQAGNLFNRIEIKYANGMGWEDESWSDGRRVDGWMGMYIE